MSSFNLRGDCFIGFSLSDFKIYFSRVIGTGYYANPRHVRMSGDFNIQNLHGHIFSWCCSEWIGRRPFSTNPGVLPIGVIYIAKLLLLSSRGLCHTGGYYPASVLLGGVNGIMSYITGPTFGEVALLFAMILFRLVPLALLAVSLERANNATLWNF